MGSTTDKTEVQTMLEKQIDIFNDAFFDNSFTNDFFGESNHEMFSNDNTGMRTIFNNSYSEDRIDLADAKISIPFKDGSFGNPVDISEYKNNGKSTSDINNFHFSGIGLTSSPTEDSLMWKMQQCYVLYKLFDPEMIELAMSGAYNIVLNTPKVQNATTKEDKKKNILIDITIALNNKAKTALGLLFKSVPGVSKSEDGKYNVQATLQALYKSKTNLMAVRLMMYLYYRIAQFKALSYLARYSGPTSKTSKRGKKTIRDGTTTDINALNQGASKLHERLLEILQTDINTMKNAVAIDEQNKVSQSVNTYDDYMKQLGEFGKNMNAKKGILTRSRDQIKTSTKSSSIYEYVSLAVMLLVILCVFTITMIPMDPNVHVTVAGLGVAAALINGLVTYMLHGRRVLESFGNPDIDSTTYNNRLATASEYLFVVQSYLLLTTTKRITEQLTKAATREFRYFKSVSDNVDRVNALMQNTKGIAAVDNNSRTARMNFYINASIIGAITMFAYVLAAAMPGLQKVVITIGVVLLVLAGLASVADVTGVVRTDGDKLYWRNPTTN